MINQDLSNLIEYAKVHLNLREEDVVYTSNLLMEKMDISSFEFCEGDKTFVSKSSCPDFFMKPIISYAIENHIIEEGEEEFFSSEILDILTPKPSFVIKQFFNTYQQSFVKAFDDLYDLCVKNDYVKSSAIAKNICWIAEKTQRKIEITINLSKPEKNNKLTAKLRNVSAGYPKCMLCKENVGYVGQGRTRRNMRTIPMVLAGEKWFWQYSPYAYFYQHGIAINEEHTPMILNGKTIEKLLDFVDFAPQYCIGSNAPLPIVGGSILAHEHFQGGMHLFPMFKVGMKKALKSPKENVEAFLPDWYNSVILLKSKEKDVLIKESEKILRVWENYSDESVGIIAKTDAPHNTLAPIVRKIDDYYLVYLLLRNNRCDEENPDGIFHAHKEYHNIKSESIGLIEAMGRFILPGRLNKQLKEVERVLSGEISRLPEDMSIHNDMLKELQKEYSKKMTLEEAHSVVVNKVENVCENILYNTAVFKPNLEGETAFGRFLNQCGYQIL